MQQLPTLEVLRRAVRNVVCTRCNLRPHNSETFAPSIARSCEPQCTIFSNLAKLAKIAHDDEGDDRAPVERQIRELICIDCHACATAGNECEKRLNRSCPLSLYEFDVVGLIEPILRKRCGTTS
jgi:hypothetical protein